jgi:hypothetical protein
MASKPHGALIEGLECMKRGGLITKYRIVWDRGSEVPKIIVGRACDTPDEALRRSIADGLAGLVGASQLVIEPRVEAGLLRLRNRRAGFSE